MQAVKRVEIVTDSLEMREVIAVLEGIGVTDYTLIKEVLGKGDRGVQAGDELTNVFQNSLLVTACPPEMISGLVAAVRPLLEKRGGICLVSDAEWVKH